MVHWNPPPIGSVKLNTDGSFLAGSPCMGSSGLILSETGAWLTSFSSWEVDGDELLAGIIAVEKGLTLAWDMGYKSVYYEADALEVIKLLQNRGNIGFQEYPGHLMMIVELLGRDWSVQGTFCVDFLARLAINNGQRFSLWKDPSPGLGSLLLRDMLWVPSSSYLLFLWVVFLFFFVLHQKKKSNTFNLIKKKSNT